MNSTNATATSAVTPYTFENKPVSIVVNEQGQPWFNAIEVCNALGFGNHRQAIDSHVDGDDVQKLDAIDSLGRKQPTNHINESGLYALIFGSTKPEAKRFKRWVTSEVLPSIRKTGQYQHTPPSPPSEPVRGLSYRECAAALGVSITTITRFIRAGNLQPEPGGGLDLEKVREAGHQVWDRYGHKGQKCGLPRPGMTPRLPVNTETNRMEAELNHGSSQTLTIHQLIDKTISNILASKRERYRQVITERLLDEYGASKLEDVPVKSAKPNLEIFAVFQEAHLEQMEGIGDQIHMDLEELERVMLQIAVEGIQKVKQHISQRVEHRVPYVKKLLRRSFTADHMLGG